jgi:hypothetical protein
MQAPSAEGCPVADEAGCPLDAPCQERSRFETFLADLSATFLSVPADQVDAQIVAGLRQLVEFLGIDRSGFGERSSPATPTPPEGKPTPVAPPSLLWATT